MGNEKIWRLGNHAWIKFNCMPVVGNTHLKYLSVEASRPLVLFPLTGWRIAFISSSSFLDLIHFSFLPLAPSSFRGHHHRDDGGHHHGGPRWRSGGGRPEAVRRWRESRHTTAVEGGQRRCGGGGRPGTRQRWREDRRATAVEGGQRLCDDGHHHGGHARADGGGRPGFATVVTTTEARGGIVVEAKRATAMEQCPPSLTSRHNRWRRRSSLDGNPLLRQPNDGRHGSGRGDGLLPAR
jgi:hypothetical protein